MTKTAEITTVGDVEGQPLRVGSVFYYPTLRRMKITAIIQAGEDRGKVFGVSTFRGEQPDDDLPMIAFKGLRSTY